MSFDTTGSGFSPRDDILMRKYLNWGCAGSTQAPRPTLTCSSNGSPAGTCSSRRMRTASFSFTTFFSSTRALGGGAGGDTSGAFGLSACAAFFSARFSAASCSAFFSISASAVRAGGVPPKPNEPSVPVPPTPDGRAALGGNGAVARAVPDDSLLALDTSDGAAPPTPPPEPPVDGIRSKGGVMSAAWATRATFGITSRGSAASSSGTVGSSTATISCRGCHSAASTAAGSGFCSASGAASATGTGRSGRIVFVVASASLFTRSSCFSTSGGATGGGSTSIAFARGSPAIFCICITGRSFVHLRSLLMEPGSGANAQSESFSISPT